MKKFLLLLVLFVFTLGCASTPKQKAYDTKDLQEGKNLISALTAKTNNSPTAMSSKISASISVNSKSYKAAGDISFNREKETFKMTLTDPIFKSLVAKFSINKQKVNLLLPLEKVMFSEDLANLNIYSYTGLKISQDFFLEICYGRIPLLKDYQIIKFKKDINNSDFSFVVLENASHQEAIFFNKETVYKIEIISKIDRQNFEIFLEDSILTENSYFYTNLKIISGKNNYTIKFKNPKLD